MLVAVEREAAEPVEDQEAEPFRRVSHAWGAYLHSMGDRPLLSREQEVRLAETIRAGRNRIRKGLRASGWTAAQVRRMIEASGMPERMDPAERAARAFLKQAGRSERAEHTPPALRDGRLQRAAATVQAGLTMFEEAREELILSNLKLVISIANYYRSRGLPILDLIQEGNIGLIRAAERFAPEKGTRFSTYATWWIRQAITRALATQSALIRIPVYLADQHRRLQRIGNQLRQKEGREPVLRKLAHASGLTEIKVRQSIGLPQEPISLDQPVTADGKGRLSDILRDPNQMLPDRRLEEWDKARWIARTLRTLTPREEKVIRLRFGLDGDQPRTLEEVGRQLSVTRERARQIETVAMTKLKHPSRRRMLRILA
jgi:RNA polymerase primary sigma factor